MTKAIQLFGKMLTFSRMKITTDNLHDIQAVLTETLSNTPSANIPIIIDSEVELDLAALIEMLWTVGVQPIGVVDGILNEQAQALRLAILPADGKRLARLKDKEQSAETLPSTEPSQQQPAQPDPQEQQESYDTSGSYHQLLRSGQSIHRFGGDLTIIGGVNQGAEAITDGTLHIYGHGLGRLVAGATGDKNARIFCQKFNPTLVSVAGTYCLSDDIPSELLGKAVEVSYDQEQGLIFNPLNQ